MKMIEGASSLAMANSSLISCSLSPTHLDNKVLEVTQKKVASASVASACNPYKMSQLKRGEGGGATALAADHIRFIRSCNKLCGQTNIVKVS